MERDHPAVEIGVDPRKATPAVAPVPSSAVPADKKQVAAQWQEWTAHQRLTGPDAVADYADPAKMNRFTWYRTHGWQLGENQVYAPEQVPGARNRTADGRREALG